MRKSAALLLVIALPLAGAVVGYLAAPVVARSHFLVQQADQVRLEQANPDAPRTLAEAHQELEWFMNGHPKHPELGLWATIHKDTGEFIGRCGLLPWTIEDEYEVEVAYTLKRQYWGQGLGSEAAQAILDHGFQQLRLPRLICLIDPNNITSQKVAQKIGMRLEREVEGIGGDNLPTLIYAARNPLLT